jgi:hypothetical protein
MAWHTLTTRSSALAATLTAGCIAACAGAVAPRVPAEPPSAQLLRELWIDPGATPRDLYWGVGGREHAPDPQALYSVEAKDDVGFSTSYDVVDTRSVKWSAKIGPEAQTEVVVSRILWGIGYHQPPLYYLPSWTVTRDGERRRESEARFRPKLDAVTRLDEYWRWADNPFVGTSQLDGLLVVLLMLNSTDLKDDNNSLYHVQPPFKDSGAAGGTGPGRWFVVRDVGAALGVTGKLFPRRNWIDGFERAGFIAAVNGDQVVFDYHGRHAELLTSLTPDDVRYGARLLQRLTDQQWRDAFRAGNYGTEDSERFIRRIKQKIADGLAVRADSRGAAPRSRPAHAGSTSKETR